MSIITKYDGKYQTFCVIISDAQKKYVMHCMTHILQQECLGILETKMTALGSCHLQV